MFGHSTEFPVTSDFLHQHLLYSLEFKTLVDKQIRAKPLYQASVLRIICLFSVAPFSYFLPPHQPGVSLLSQHIHRSEADLSESPVNPEWQMQWMCTHAFELDFL